MTQNTLREDALERRREENFRWLRAVCPYEWALSLSLSDLEARVHPDFHPHIAAIGETNIALIGSSGRGKSASFALALRQHLVRTRFERRVAWVRARELTESFRPWDEKTRAIERAKLAADVDVLLLDDLGQESEHGLLLEVVEERYAKGRVTAITSGFTVEALSEKYPENLFRRLMSSGGKTGTIIECGDDKWNPPPLQAARPLEAKSAEPPTLEQSARELAEGKAKLDGLAVELAVKRTMPKTTPEETP